MPTRTHRCVTPVVALLSYLSVVAVLTSPQFTPLSTVGPAGILRGDQILIPLLIIALTLTYADEFTIPSSYLLWGLVGITVTIGVSTVINAQLYGTGVDVGDLFDILVWATYAGTVVAVGGNLPRAVARHALRLAVVVTTLIAVIAVLQSMAVPFAIEVLAPVYTHNAHLRVIARRPTATTLNPNTLGILLSIPLYYAVARSYRSFVLEESLIRYSSVVGWALVALLCSYVILLTGSRSALLAVVAGLSTIAVVVHTGDAGIRKRRFFLLGTGAVMVTVALVLIVVVFEVGRYDYLANPLQDPSLQKRFEIWSVTLPLIRNRPLLGHGPSKDALYAAGLMFVDSGFLSWLFHYGIVGIFAYGLTLAGTLRAALGKVLAVGTFERDPVFWAASVAVVGWVAGSTVAWSVAGIVQNRRLFAFAVLFMALSIAGKTDPAGSKAS